MSSQAKVSKKTLKKQNEVSIALNLNLRELVEDNDIKQTELAAKLNVSKSCFNKWLTTERQPNLEHLILLADHFNVTLDYLVRPHSPKARKFERMDIPQSLVPAVKELLKLKLKE